MQTRLHQEIGYDLSNLPVSPLIPRCQYCAPVVGLGYSVLRVYQLLVA
jgi:hypothetical protein